MKNFPAGLENFAFTEEQKASLEGTFDQVLTGSKLHVDELKSSRIAAFKKISGVYFWVMRWDDRMFRIYIGKTKDMLYRFDNYVSGYQPHSPNDFKMQIFRSFITKTIPNAALDLYFIKTEAEHLTKSENEAIRLYLPLLNKRSQPTTETREKLRDAFIEYYESSFTHLLFGNAKAE